MNEKSRAARILALFAASAMIFTILAGCGGTTPTGVPTSAGTTATAVPKAGGSVIVGIQQEPGSFNPYLATAAGDREILFNVCEGLYKSDASGAMQPALATSYTMSADARTYTFVLRQGVVFHDGKTLTADDVVYSFGLAMAKGSVVSGLGGIDRVAAPDAQTIVITLKDPDVELMPFMGCPIVPKDAANLADKPIGTGPFKFESYSIGQSVVLVRNDKYWIPGRPYLDRVEFRISANTDAAFLELKAGNIDIFPYLSFERSGEIADKYDTREDLKNMVQLLALNNTRAPFSDPRVREAINLAIDRKGLLDLTNEGYGTALTSGMSPALGRFYNASLEGMFDQDLVKAKSLLAEAGFANGFETTITVPSNYGYHVNTATVLAEQLKAVGIKATIVQVDWTTWINEVYKARNFDTTVIALTSEYTPKDVLSRYVSTAGGNFINFASAEYDRVYGATLLLTDEAARIEGYKQLQKILADDAASVFLQDPVTMVAVSKKIGGYETFKIYAQDLSTVYRID